MSAGGGSLLPRGPGRAGPVGREGGRALRQLAVPPGFGGVAAASGGAAAAGRRRGGGAFPWGVGVAAALGPAA